ncbi:MAG TPA: ABC transporter permease [Clostridiales bacterium]|nr:ABC transporter permease [Clostridiales bacterium]
MLTMYGVELVKTLYMTLASTAIAYLIGLPIGVLLIVTDKGRHPFIRFLNALIGLPVNFLRSIPFLILMIALFPFTALIIGTTIGPNAAIVALVVGSAPFIARLVESSLREVDSGVIEAAQSMGASTAQIVRKVLLPEALPSLIVGATIAVTTILSYSAMAGILGAGGLGDVAIRYGLYRYDTPTMLVTLVLLVLLVQTMQEAGMKLAKIVDRRIN